MNVNSLSVITLDVGNALEMGNVSLRLPQMSPDEFAAFCQRNPDLNVELSANGAIILMASASAKTDLLNTEILLDLGIWNRSLPKRGHVFGPSAGFRLPNSAVRSPDAAWLSAEQWEEVFEGEQATFPEICPQFILELMSPSDRLSVMLTKMEEYIENGAKLGWLIYRKRRQVYVFRPGQPMEIMDNPITISGDPELPGFVLTMKPIFEG
jgi:Uma2 family endonuclease